MRKSAKSDLSVFKVVCFGLVLYVSLFSLFSLDNTAVAEIPLESETSTLAQNDDIPVQGPSPAGRPTPTMAQRVVDTGILILLLLSFFFVVYFVVFSYRNSQKGHRD